MMAFSKYLLDDYVKGVRCHLEAHFPKELNEQGINEPDLDQFVLQGMIEARKYGVTKEFDVRLYIECLVSLGPKFAKNKDTAWAGVILNRDDIDGTEKMVLINDYLIFELGSRE
jgi:hypothetical protein